MQSLVSRRGLTTAFAPPARVRRGFTMIEVLVTVFIIVLLGALALGGILIAHKRGIEIRTRSDLALIGTALEAYKTDFGDYPRFDDTNTDSTGVQNTQLLNYQGDRGARLLCRCLLGPGPASAPSSYVQFDAFSGDRGPDGADGPGFRIRAGAGKVYGPYIDASKFKLGNCGVAQYDSTYFVDATLLDQNGNSILYYPGVKTAYISASSGGNSANGAYVQAFPPQGNGTQVTRPMYNSYDNIWYGYGTSTPERVDVSIPTHGYLLDNVQMEYILGDRNTNGYIDQVESPVTTQAYLLWTAGPDGKYGFGLGPTGVPLVPAQGMKTDDITNFDMAPDLVK